jgi:hypothetical protein
MSWRPGTRAAPPADVPGSQVQVTLAGLDPRIGYAFAVAAVDQWSRRGLLSAPVHTAASFTITPLPRPTWAVGSPRVW